MVRPFENGLAMHQLRYADEIKSFDEVELGDLAKPTARELELAERLVAQLQHDHFDPTAYTDEVKERVRALLADKAKSGDQIVITPEAAKGPPMADLMEALRASLGNGKHKPTRRAPANGHRQARVTRVARKRRAA
jgi:DNA end-binding protein Ku